MNSSVTDNLTRYYSERAKEYDETYSRSDPERVREQEKLATLLRQTFTKGNILEIACGTGYWTAFLQQPEATVFATDTSLEMLTLAQQRFSGQKQQPFFFVADAYQPLQLFPKFVGAFAGCWFSHIPQKKISSFLKTLHSRLREGSSVVFIDNVFRSDLGGELIKKKAENDSWKKRSLKNGKQFLILKNYYTPKKIEQIFEQYSAKKPQVIYGQHFWAVSYQYNGS